MNKISKKIVALATMAAFVLTLVPAAAFGAGIGALMQEWAIVQGNDLSLNGQNMRFYLIQGADRPGAYDYPNREWGYGMVNIYDAFLSMRR